MKTRWIFMLALLVSCLIACTSEDDVLQNDNSMEEESGEIVLRERDKNYPLTDYEKLKSKHMQTRATSDLSFKDFIGRSYKLDYYPYENAQNLGFPVIDMERYLADHPGAFQSVPVKESNSTYYSYSNFERYETKVNKAKTVSSGIKLNLGIFSIGSKKTHKEVFKSSDVETTQSVLGELAVRFYDRKYELLIPTNVREDIFNNYMYKDFKEQLYYSSIDELIKNYGGFVLTKFLSGGQAFALYHGKYYESLHDEETVRENNMEAEMSASLKKYNGSGSFSLGKNQGSAMSITNRFQNIQFSIRTLGGTPAYSQFTIPKDINSVVFDLSAWSNSLLNESNLTIANLVDESLVPITDFIEESNLKRMIYDIYEKGRNENTKLMEEPHIRIAHFAYMIYSTQLITRYGDVIHLTETVTSNKQYLEREVERISNIFPHLKIVVQDALMPSASRAADFPKLNEFDIEKMSKYIDPKSNKIYLLTLSKTSNYKLAYTLYDENVVNDYIFKELIDSLPINNSVTLETIRNEYNLIAL